MVLIIDNYDSFTFNIAHYFSILEQEVLVKKNDEISINDIQNLKPKFIVISPGPCNPNKAGISLQVIQHFAGLIPILGVCLGHQCIGQFFGGTIIKANKIMHGRTSVIKHTNKGVFEGLANPMTVTRYHSLVVKKSNLPACLELTAWSSDSITQTQHTETTQHSPPNDWQNNDAIEIMGLKHTQLAIEGVQFHPESILSEQGLALFNNFLIQYGK